MSSKGHRKKNQTRATPGSKSVNQELHPDAIAATEEIQRILTKFKCRISAEVRITDSATSTRVFVHKVPEPLPTPVNTADLTPIP